MKNILPAMVLLVAFSTGAVTAEDNTIYKELVDQGVALSNGKTIKLPEPVMADGLKAEQQQAAMTQVCPKNQLDSYLRGDKNDYFVSKYLDEKGDQPTDSIGRRVDVYFVAKGKFATIINPAFMKQRFGNNQAGAGNGNGGEPKDEKRAENGTAQLYTDKELQDRKLSPIDKEKFKERYVHASLQLLGQVQAGGTAHAIETQNEESLLIAFKLDPRFAKDPQYPNQYQLIKINNAGAPVLGNPEPYSGFGGYAKITKLQGPTDKLFVEYHLLFDEPHDWFNGTTALVSKLDYSYQTDIRKFRRDLLKPLPPANNQQPAPGNNPPAQPNNTQPVAPGEKSAKDAK